MTTPAHATTISRIRLELAREPGHPFGDREHFYDIYAPLTEDARIDASSWRDNRAAYRVRRFRPGENVAYGRLVHGPGGRWIFDYSDLTDRDDETGFRFGDERFIPGEYVSIHEDDGKMHTYQVIAIRPL